MQQISHAILPIASSSIYSPSRRLIVSAVVVRVTCDLPLQAIPSDDRWSHISGLQLADPDFGHLRGVDLLLVVEVFTEVVLHSRRSGSPGLTIAFDTQFSWVLAWSASSYIPAYSIVAHHTALLSFKE